MGRSPDRPIGPAEGLPCIPETCGHAGPAVGRPRDNFIPPVITQGFLATLAK
jgi:hypothetical protein